MSFREPYKVVICSAGIGSRVGPYTKFVNKALISVGGMPAIVQIISNFPESCPVVIVLGYKGDLLEQVLRMFFPSRTFEFVYVEKFEGEGSGLGYSLNAARDYLQCPFIFSPNDTLVKLQGSKSEFGDLYDPNLIGNWVGFHYLGNEADVDITEYRTIEHNEMKLTALNGKATSSSRLVYIGLCGVQDYEAFWSGMDEADALEIGEAAGVRALGEVTTKEFREWFDTGNLASLSTAQAAYSSGSAKILEKEHEAIWFTRDTVIKFHIDEEFISDRIKRIKFLPQEMLPEVISVNKNLYQYRYVRGEVLSQEIDEDKVLHLLDLMNSLLWTKKAVNIPEDQIQTALRNFYHDKTRQRVEYYLSRFEHRDQAEEINGRSCPTIIELLESIPWEKIYKSAKIGGYHGDFHSENILMVDSGFKLLDWRQNFGSLGIQVGDVYYDLAKFNHGLLVDHAVVFQNQFEVRRVSERKISINIPLSFQKIEAQKVFFAWCHKNGYSVENINILTGLIFLNIAGLHSPPYSDFLFYLGKFMLSEEKLGLPSSES